MSVRDHADVPMQWVGADKPIDGTEAWREFRSEIVVYSDSEHCTIYPREASIDCRLTEWISADGGSFVNVGEME